MSWTGPMDMSASSRRVLDSVARQTPDRRRPDRVNRLRPPTDPVPTLIALLDCHGDPEALLWGDQVVAVGECGVELDPFDLAVEGAVGASVVLADGGAGVEADVACLVGGVEHRHGRLDAAFADLVAVDV